MSLSNLKKAYEKMFNALESMPATVEEITGMSSEEFAEAKKYLYTLNDDANIKSDQIDPQYLPELTEYEKKIAKKWVQQVAYQKMGAKSTICHLILKNGFEEFGYSAPIDEENFVQQIGNVWALKDALNKVGSYDAFLQYNVE